MKRSLLYNHSTSLLENQSVLKPKASRSGKILAATLVLTSLVDAFSILVIYLMVNTTSGLNVDLADGIQLPQALQTEMIDAGLLVQITSKGILVENQEVDLENLSALLQQTQAQLKEQDDPRASKLILQADKESDFDRINPVLLAGTQNGFETIVFAVLQKEGSL